MQAESPRLSVLSFLTHPCLVWRIGAPFSYELTQPCGQVFSRGGYQIRLHRTDSP